MALINCPECEKQISDKALFCPNCGFPISKNTKLNSEAPNTYNVILQGIFGNKIEIIKCISHIIPINLHDAVNKSNQTPCYLKENIPYEEAKHIEETLESIGASIIIEEHNKNDATSIKKYKIDVLSCPRCGSTAISTDKRGYSIISGFFGSNKTINRCGKCGWSWQPK